MSEYMRIALDKIGQRYSELRIIDPGAETAMVRSMQFYGQMTPVVVCQTEKRPEMIDGFKQRQRGHPLKGGSPIKGRVKKKNTSP